MAQNDTFNPNEINTNIQVPVGFDEKYYIEHNLNPGLTGKFTTIADNPILSNDTKLDNSILETPSKTADKTESDTGFWEKIGNLFKGDDQTETQQVDNTSATSKSLLVTDNISEATAKIESDPSTKIDKIVIDADKANPNDTVTLREAEMIADNKIPVHIHNNVIDGSPVITDKTNPELVDKLASNGVPVFKVTDVHSNDKNSVINVPNVVDTKYQFYDAQAKEWKNISSNSLRNMEYHPELYNNTPLSLSLNKDDRDALASGKLSRTDPIASDLNKVMTHLNEINGTVKNTNFLSNVQGANLSVSTTSVPSGLVDCEQSLFSISGGLLDCLNTDINNVASIADTYYKLDQKLAENANNLSNGDGLLGTIMTDPKMIAIINSPIEYNLNYSNFFLETEHLGIGTTGRVSASEIDSMLSNGKLTGPLLQNLDAERADAKATQKSIGNFLNDLGRQGTLKGAAYDCVAAKFQQYSDLMSERVAAADTLQAAMEQALKLVRDYMEGYDELDDSKIPELKAEIVELQETIESLQAKIDATHMECSYSIERKTYSEHCVEVHDYSADARAGFQEAIDAANARIDEINAEIAKLEGLPEIIKQAEEIINNAIVEIYGSFGVDVGNITTGVPSKFGNGGSGGGSIANSNTEKEELLTESAFNSNKALVDKYGTYNNYKNKIAIDNLSAASGAQFTMNANEIEENEEVDLSAVTAGMAGMAGITGALLSETAEEKVPTVAEVKAQRDEFINTTYNDLIQQDKYKDKPDLAREIATEVGNSAYEDELAAAYREQNCAGLGDDAPTIMGEVVGKPEVTTNGWGKTTTVTKYEDGSIKTETTNLFGKKTTEITQSVTSEDKDNPTIHRNVTESDTKYTFESNKNGNNTKETLVVAEGDNITTETTKVNKYQNGGSRTVTTETSPDGSSVKNTKIENSVGTVVKDQTVYTDTEGNKSSETQRITGTLAGGKRVTDKVLNEDNSTARQTVKYDKEGDIVKTVERAETADGEVIRLTKEQRDDGSIEIHSKDTTAEIKKKSTIYKNTDLTKPTAELKNGTVTIDNGVAYNKDDNGQVSKIVGSLKFSGENKPELLSESEFNRSSAMEQKYGSYENYKNIVASNQNDYVSIDKIQGNTTKPEVDAITGADPSNKPGNNPAKDPVKDPTKDPVKDPTKDPVKDPGNGNPGNDPGNGNPGNDPGNGNPGNDPGSGGGTPIPTPKEEKTKVEEETKIEETKQDTVVDTNTQTDKNNKQVINKTYNYYNKGGGSSKSSKVKTLENIANVDESCIPIVEQIPDGCVPIEPITEPIIDEPIIDEPAPIIDIEPIEDVQPIVDNTVVSSGSNGLKTVGIIAGAGLAVGAAALGAYEYKKAKENEEDSYDEE